jgi:hypothetical protein
MAAPLRIAVNARALEQDRPPLVRLTAAHLVDRLVTEEDLRLELFAAEPISESLSGGAPVRVVSPSIGVLREASWDQLAFPRAATRSHAQLLLYLHPSAAITGSAPCVSWYGDGRSGAKKTEQPGRLTRSLALAGLRGAAAVLRPSDSPAGPIPVRWVAVPASVPSAFFAGADAAGAPVPADLPESFVLAVCESAAALRLLLAAWSWVESSLGDTFVLLVIAADETERLAGQQAAEEMRLADSVRSVFLADAAFPAVFQRAAALLHGGEGQNAAALRWALAGGLPVAAPATAVSEAIVGPAGYLVPKEARALGAACLTLLVEEGTAASLREKGRARAWSFRPEAAGPAWAEALWTAATGRVR